MTSSRYAKGTEEFIKSIASLDQHKLFLELEVFSRTLIPEIVIAYYRVTANAVIGWLVWEATCRGREYTNSCRNRLPATASPRTAVSYYNSLLKKTIVKATIDLSPPWLIPPWILRYIEKFYRSEVERIEQTINAGPAEIASRLIMYSTYAYLIAGISETAMEYSRSRLQPYAHVTASYIYWDIVYPLLEAINEGLRPLGWRAVSTLGRLNKVVTSYANTVLARLFGGNTESSRGYRQGEHLENAVRNTMEELKNIFLTIISEKRLESSI